MNYDPKTLKKLSLPTLILALMVALGGCESDADSQQETNPRSEVLSLLKRDFFEVRPLTYNQLPNTRANFNRADDTTYTRDSAGIPLFDYRGTTSYHPVSIGNRCADLLAAYGETGDSTYLIRTKQYLDQLRDIAVRQDEMILFPYHFRFALHGDSANLFEPPWFSGMAQGVILSDIVRFIEFSGDSSYLPFADSVVNSFFALRGKYQDWTVRTDSLGFYWIEEYPLDEPDMTLNGYIASVFGLYDYYRLTGNDNVRELLVSCFTTLRYYAPQFLASDLRSYYCLKHKQVATPAYHAFHIQLFEYLELMSADPYFGIIAQLLREQPTNP